MAVKIKSIEKNSIAYALGILSGDILLSVNKNEIRDILDFRFFETEKELEITVLRDTKTLNFHFTKTVYESIGLQFDSYLMDKEKSCKNKCIFCFIDQLPKGMRDSLYFKDDDERLSFLFGNYITLTNIDLKDVDRIIKMRISPINVSVHTMNKALRCEMMNNRFAGEKLEYIKILADAGIKINAQLVLCPDINDGKELEHSLNELMKLGDNLQSLACVPVGLTKHRDGLFKLSSYTKEKAQKVIDIIEKTGEENLQKYGQRKVYPSDEFYIIAKRELPDFDFYEDFPQIENGVGMFRSLEEELLFALEEFEGEIKPQKITTICGEAIYELMNNLLNEIRNKWNNIEINLIAIKNEFFGDSVDVTGLITGGDIINQLKGKNLHDKLLIPTVCLKADKDIFLDDVSIEDLEKELDIKVCILGSTGQDLVDVLKG